MRCLGLAVLAACLTGVVIGCGSTRASSDEPDAGADTPLHTALRLGSDPWPPFTDNAPRPRVAIDLVHTALKRSGVRAATSIQDDFGAITRQIREGSLDGSAAIWHSAERETYLLFSAPYFENRLVLVAREGVEVSGVGLADLPGKRIGIVAGYDYGTLVRDVSGPIFVAGPSDLENLKLLVRGQYDYVLADELLIHHLLQQNEKARRQLRVGDRAIHRRSLHLAVRRRHREAAEIIRRFNRAIQIMMTDGSFNRILQLDAIEVDIDGDGQREVVLAGGSIGRTPPARSYALFRGDADGGSRARYHVDGRTYESWDDIPRRYRATKDREGEGVQLYELNF